ncbi:MAG: hypothetical protein ACKVTZ_22320 [Bacteroidia bacterium]
MSKLEHLRAIQASLRKDKSSKENIDALKKQVEHLITYFDIAKIKAFMIKNYDNQKSFAEKIGEKYAYHADTNMSTASASVVSKALNGESSQLGTVLYYLIIEHDDFDICLYEKKENEDATALKETIEQQKLTIEQQNKTIDSLEELRKRNDVIIMHFTDMLLLHKEQIQHEKSFIKKFINTYYNNNEEFKMLLKIAEDKYQN